MRSHRRLLSQKHCCVCFNLPHTTQSPVQKSLTCNSSGRAIAALLAGRLAPPPALNYHSLGLLNQDSGGPVKRFRSQVSRPAEPSGSVDA
jgi:hypothetical protein